MEINAKMLEDAIKFATDKHEGVVRKGNGLPYITHPLAVMAILVSIKKSNNPFLLGIVGILHDVVEDCYKDNHKEGLDEIADRFSHEVAGIVEKLTSDKEKIKLMGKKEYLLDKMLSMSSYALRIKLADRYHNISDLASLDEASRKKSILETEYILEGLTKRHLTKTHKILIKMIKKEISKNNN